MSTQRRPEPATLVDLIRLNAERDPDRIAYRFNGEPRTFAKLWTDVAALAHMLRSRGIEPGDRVVMPLPNGHDFFIGFYGAQAAGAIAVPLFPQLAPDAIAGFARLCGSRCALVPAGTPTSAIQEWSQQHGLQILATDTIPAAHDAADLPTVTAQDVAFLQYTSGSTGDPKGVVLPHGHLITNARQMIEGMQITSHDRFVSWLPCYHDLGLIVMTIVPFLVGAELHLLPAGLSDTRPWLDTIERVRGTFTAAPDFGYRLALRRLRAEGPDAQRPDLSSLRVALNAAEPIRATTLDDFHRTFELTNVMVGAYGLAEATVGVSMSTPSQPNRVDDQGNVSAGVPFPDITVAVLDDNDDPVPDGVAGHLVVHSPATTPGYFENPVATDGLLRADGSIHTGDIAYLDGNEIFVLGRSKDVIIHGGHTVYPDEIEEIANALPAVRYSAAFGATIDDLLGEQLIVVAEIQPDLDDETRQATVVAITAGAKARVGFRPARTLLVEPSTIPLTHNGKLQRRRLRDQFADGLGDAVLFP